jgi:hypothetical protein
LWGHRRVDELKPNGDCIFLIPLTSFRRRNAIVEDCKLMISAKSTPYCNFTLLELRETDITFIWEAVVEAKKKPEGWKE